MTPKKVLILAPYPLGLAPSQRFRFEHFLKYFPEKNIEYRFQSFWSEKSWQKLYKPGHAILKFGFLLQGFLRRIKIAFRSFRFDYIFIHRELTPIGPPVFEYFYHRFFPGKIIYDFDDAIWLPNTSAVNKAATRLKFHHKVKSICRWSWKISTGNQYLREFAAQYSANIIVNPTVVDTERYHNQVKIHTSSPKLTIGWTGTHSTAMYLKMLEKPLRKLYRDISFQFLVISNQPPELELENVVFVPWDKEKEIAQLLQIDIGVMPLEDSRWEKGKCGFKLIQYLSLQIPAVASPVGVNPEIIDHSENGYLAKNDGEWEYFLKMLLSDHQLRNKMGEKGRKKIKDQFSVRAGMGRFFSSFE